MAVKDIDQGCAKRIKRARELSGLSQHQAARKLKMHRPTITLIELGKQNVRPEQFFSFAKLYQVDVTWLLEGKVSLSKANKISSITRQLKAMSNEKLDAVGKSVERIRRK